MARRLFRAEKLRMPVHSAPSRPSATCWSHDHSSGSDFSSQCAMATPFYALADLMNREPQSGRGADRGGAGIEDSAGPEHQRRLDDVALQQIRAEGAFLRHEGVTRRVRHRERRARQQARFPDVRADDDSKLLAARLFQKVE